MKQIRDGFAAAAEAKVDELLARGSFDAVTGSGRGLSAVGFSRCRRVETAKDASIYCLMPAWF